MAIEASSYVGEEWDELSVEPNQAQEMPQFLDVFGWFQSLYGGNLFG